MLSLSNSILNVGVGEENPNGNELLLAILMYYTLY